MPSNGSCLRIIRETEESPDTIIAKDELYQRFERWYRDHNYVTIPERRVFFVTLKNKYALSGTIRGRGRQLDRYQDKILALEKTYFKNYAPPLRQPCPRGAGAYAMPPYYLCRVSEHEYR